MTPDNACGPGDGTSGGNGWRRASARRGEHCFGVGPQCRRGSLDARRRVAHVRERADLAHAPEGRVVELDDAFVGEHLRELEELVGLEERVGADVVGDEDVHPLGARLREHAFPDPQLQRFDVFDRRDPERRLRVERVVEDVLHPERDHPVAEVVVLPGAHLDELAVGALRGEEAHHDAAVERPRRLGEPLAVGSAPAHVLAHEEGGFAVEQAGLDPLTHPGALAHEQGGEDAVQRELRGAVRRDRRRRIERCIAVLVRDRTAQEVESHHPPRGGGDVDLVGASLRPRVVAPVPGDRAVDDARVHGGDGLVADPEALGDPRPEALDDDVGALCQRECLRPIGVARQVEHHRALAAVPHEEAGLAAREVTAWRLDLHDVGAVVGEDHGRHRVRPSPG